MTNSGVHRSSSWKRHYTNFFEARPPVSFAIQYSDQTTIKLGPSEPEFALSAVTRSGDLALDARDRLAIAESYMNGDLDVQGSLLALMEIRSIFNDKHPLTWIKRYTEGAIDGRLRRDERLISAHYDLESEFFLTFLDTRHRCYTQGKFGAAASSLEDAITAKLANVLSELDVRPGDHILDVGAGWGAFMEYAVGLGYRVTSLTLSSESEKYLADLVRTKDLAGATVARQHLYSFESASQFDAIVCLGVTEHLPNYGKSLATYDRLLKPGGRIHLDALAMKKQHRISSFMSKHIYPGDASPLILAKFLNALRRTHLDILTLRSERVNYLLTCREWASRLESAERSIVDRWGENLYRRYRLFLWGSAAGFGSGLLQAYSLTLVKPFDQNWGNF